MSDAKDFILSKPSTDGPSPALYREGQRVQLVALEEGWDGDPLSPAVPAEEGVILSYDWHDWGAESCYMYVVEVDEQYRDHHEGDDGLRELSEDQIVKVLDKDS